MPHITFRIEYATTWGESLYVRFSIGGNGTQLLPMKTTDGRIWQGETELPAYTELHYTYLLYNDAGKTLRSLREAAFHTQTGQNGHIVQHDRWVVRDIPSCYRHSAFTECVFGNEDFVSLPPETCALRIMAVPPPKGYRWAVTGECTALGEWDTKRALRLERSGVYEWQVPLTREAMAAGGDYKYILLPEDGDDTRAEWESGENRTLPPFERDSQDVLIVTDDMPRTDVPAWRGAGVVIPVFSLRSCGSQGIGDFGDLCAFIGWATATGFNAIQVLPVNDTTATGTWRDSYPYNCVSVFALHPIYLDMRDWTDLPLYQNFADRAKQLNALPDLDYEAVFRLKTAFLNELYRQCGREVMTQSAYADFCEDNRVWLVPYARFMAEKSRHIAGMSPMEAAFFSFVQYLLHRQMQKAHDAARAGGIILKGDIPIGVNPDSVPAIVDRRLFHFDGHAGAPPDAFATKGQNWGFPTYNWDEMARDDYHWWRSRLGHMSLYFDAYRIDHVLGFFRIWEIPANQHYGLLGRFRPALPLSENEIRAYGFAAAPISRYAVATISRQRLETLAREHADADLHRYFTPLDGENFKLRGEYDTQQKILTSVADTDVRRLLLDTACEVLFIADPDDGGWHPRIGAQQTDVFRSLSPSNQDAFTRLHDDFFYVRHNTFWAENATKKLSAIVGATSTDVPTLPMLPCAEDLGMVPASVKGVLDRLQILSLEIQRMPKTYGIRFARLADNPYLSVATIDTHDMPPLRLWWLEDHEQTQQFWTDVLGGTGSAPEEATPEICEKVVKMHLESPSMLCLIVLQDYLAMDKTLRRQDCREEQINVPANPNQYWRYRMHLNIEDLVGATGFNEKLRGLITAAHRG